MYSPNRPPSLHTPGNLIVPQDRQTTQYQIVRLLGKGGMGETYEAKQCLLPEQLSHNQSQLLNPNQHPNSNQALPHVALKVLALNQMVDWKSLDLFEREAKVLAHLNHPGIPRYLDSFYVDTTPTEQVPANRYFYLVREFIPGESLGDRVSHGWHPQESELKAIALQVLRILDYLHTLSPPLIHRDIKPQNLIRRPDGTISLVDFGSVQEIYRHTFLGSNTFVGTAGYMPPEQFRGQVSPASDLYGLGATLLYLATHKTPEQLPQSRMKVDLATCTNFSHSFTAWLDTLLEPMEEDRFQQAKAAARTLKQPGLLLSQKNPSSNVIASTSAILAKNVLPAITRPANARSVVERSPQEIVVKLPLGHRKIAVQRSSQNSYLQRWWKATFASGDRTYILFAIIAIFIVCILLGTVFVATATAGGITGSPSVLFILLLFGIVSAIFMTSLIALIGSQQIQVDTLKLTISQHLFQLEYFCHKKLVHMIQGFSKDLYISLQPDYQTHPKRPRLTCCLSEKTNTYRFGASLIPAEQEWLVDEISVFLKSIRQSSKT